MATRAEARDKVEVAGGVAAEHDAYVRAKVRKGLEQSRDRAAMIPIGQVWRDLSVEHYSHAAGAGRSRVDPGVDRAGR